MGYVGLPLACEFAKAGFQVHGIDVDPKKIDSLKRGLSYISDVPSSEISALVQNNHFHPTCDFSVIRDVATISICVPTPLRKTKEPDISYVVSAADEVEKYLNGPKLIVLESTTYPGTTEELILPKLSGSQNRQVGKDFFLAFSPERIDPGNKQFNLKNTPKILGGVTPSCTELALSLYRAIIPEVHPCSSPKTAEMVKLLENTFRAVNIAMVNEVALMCDKLGINAWEVIDLAGTKPFGFMKFYPGPGLGGHCIPIDPHYLSWKLKSLNYNARFIQLAEEINSHMPEYVVLKVVDSLNNQKKPLSSSKILLYGMSYKNDVGDVRESPAIDIIKILKQKGAEVSYVDPYVPTVQIDNITFTSLSLNDRVSHFDCVIITTAHSLFDLKHLGEKAKLIVDTRNAMGKYPQYKNKVTIL